MSRPPRGGASWLGRVGWLFLLWAAGVSALAVAALLLRALMALAGMKT